MYFLFADETNTAPKYNDGVKFFVYGGLIIPAEKMEDLDAEICRLRRKYDYKDTDSLKFDTNSRPKHVDKEDFKNLKNEIVGLCVKFECTLLLYVVLHNIARTSGLPKTVKWGADHIFQKFNEYLIEKKRIGIVLVDRLSDSSEYKLLTEKFTRGLIYPASSRPLNNIRLYGVSCDNASHFNSVADVLIGTFRYCINEPFNKGAAKTMMKKLVGLLWAKQINKQEINPFEKGLTFRPVQNKIQKPEYRKEYDELLRQINELLE